MPNNYNFNLNLIGEKGMVGGGNINKLASTSTPTSLSKGVYLPKSLFKSSSYFSYQSPYKQSQGQGGGFDYKRFPPAIDWGLLFNLALFTIFVCSIFYICLYRYRNKQKIRKETELKQKKLVYEFNQALKEKHRQETVKKYNQILENKRINQMTVGGGLNNFGNNFENPYLIKNDNLTSSINNQSNQASQSLDSQFQTLQESHDSYSNSNSQFNNSSQNSFGELGTFNQFEGGGFSNLNFDTNFNDNNFNFNNIPSNSNNKSFNSTKNDKNSYELARQSYKIDSYKNKNISNEIPFNNETNLMNWG
jgi:hypothetical protein